ncbi:hypothetical protein ACFFIX_06830 [Metabacillus herbersteinensis]|uniref:Reverse transcriptase RNase H-like domain-containing protein n=1 Tax=Metabacillus herbersteinensis TaxID=283816 RepID=A0ABV6GD80_9BACI
MRTKRTDCAFILSNASLPCEAMHYHLAERLLIEAIKRAKQLLIKNRIYHQLIKLHNLVRKSEPTTDT